MNAKATSAEDDFPPITRTLPTTEEKFVPLPDGDYPYTVVGCEFRELPDWKREKAVEFFNANQKERVGKALAKGEAYEPRFVDSFEGLPMDKKTEFTFKLIVRGGEHDSALLPSVDIGSRWTTNREYIERSRWYNFARYIVPKTKEMVEAKQLPNPYEDIVGFGAIAEVETTDKGRNKIVKHRKDDSVFGKRIFTPPLVGAVESEGAAGDEEGAEIPF